MSWSEDLYAAAEKHRQKGRPSSTPLHVVPPGDGTTTTAAAAALNGIARRLAEALEGTRNPLLNWAAYRAGQYHGAGVLAADEAKRAIYAAAYACGLDEPEVTTTFRSGWEAGQLKPSHPVEAHVKPKFADFTAVIPAPDSEDEPAEGGLPQPIDWHKLWADDTEDEWLLEPLIPARRLVALYSAPKVGKSLLMLEIASAIASGRPVLGQPGQAPRTVLYVDYENDPRGDVRTRLQAIGYTPDDLDRLRYLSYPVIGGLDTVKGALTLIGCVDEQEAELVVIDTVSRSVAGEENENDTWLNFYRLTGLALKQRGVACIRLDHSGKDETKGMRGGSAKSGDVDAIWQMRKITEETVTLRCDDARLMITERELTLRRTANPLSHKVEANAGGAAWEALVNDLVEWMDEAGMPAEMGAPALEEALKKVGKHSTRNSRRAAVKVRKQRLGVLTLEDE